MDESTSAVRCTSYGDHILPAAFPLTLSICGFFVRSLSPGQKMDTYNQGNQWAESKFGRRQPTQQLDQHWARYSPLSSDGEQNMNLSLHQWEI